MLIMLGIIFTIIIIVVLIYNSCINLRNKVKQSKSGIEVYLNQRFDLIPNLVECVKQYSKYEKETLERVIKLRSKYFEQVDKNLQDATKLNSECNKILAISESVPNLKASEQFLKLEKTLIKLESQIQAARRIYNGDVTLYNTRINMFPINILASIFNFKEVELFQIEEYKKENININM